MILACLKWGEKYGAQHVNRLHAMLERHYRQPHQLVCFTDNPHGITAAVHCMPIWPYLEEFGGCWRRLYLFSDEMADVIGPRFASIDLDCVIVGDVSDIFSRKEPFVISEYQGVADKREAQRYNGSLFIMDAGARSIVWTTFKNDIPERIRLAGRVGTDQAWIREILGPHEARIGAKDGIYEAKNLGNELPENARIVFFSGPRDPSDASHAWLSRHYH